MKRPASQFYWGDWLNCQELRAVSLAARGLWIDMLCFMRQGNPVGHLTNKATGGPITAEQLARMVGESAERVRELLHELEAAGVPSKDANGAYVSRRMIRDEVAYAAYVEGQAAAGKRGAAKRWKPESPSQPNQIGKGSDGLPHPIHGQAHPDPTVNRWGSDASSSSSSSSSSEEEGAAGPAKVVAVIPPGRHRRCHPEVCNWNDPSVRRCMPFAQASELAANLPGLPQAKALEVVLEWARTDTPTADYVAPSSDFEHWRRRWDARREALLACTAISAVPSEAETMARYG